MASGKGKAKDRRTGEKAHAYSGPERRIHCDRRKVPRRANARRYVPRRLDERRTSGVGEVIDDRRAAERRAAERRRQKRRLADRGVKPPGRRAVDHD
jgi:hypothetical protein